MSDTAAPLTPEEAVALRRLDWHDEWCATRLDEPEDPCDCMAGTIRRLLATLDFERAARAGDDGLRAAAQAVVDATDSYLVTSIGTVEAWEALVATIDALRAALDAPAPALDPHDHIETWCAKCVEHGVVEEVRRNA